MPYLEAVSSMPFSLPLYGYMWISSNLNIVRRTPTFTQMLSVSRWTYFMLEIRSRFKKKKKRTSPLRGLTNQKTHSSENDQVKWMIKQTKCSKKKFERPSESWRTVTENHFKRFQESLAAWLQKIKKWGVAKDFQSVLRVTVFVLTWAV